MRTYPTELDSPLKRMQPVPGPVHNACACMGPQNGDPVCPCKMWIWDVLKEDGKWTMSTLYGGKRKPIE